MATPKHFRTSEILSFSLNDTESDMGREITCISSSFRAADTMCSGTHFDGAVTHADMSRILGLELHHESPHLGTDFGPLDPWSFWSDFAPPDI